MPVTKSKISSKIGKLISSSWVLKVDSRCWCPSPQSLLVFPERKRKLWLESIQADWTASRGNWETPVVQLNGHVERKQARAERYPSQEQRQQTTVYYRHICTESHGSNARQELSWGNEIDLASVRVARSWEDALSAYLVEHITRTYTSNWAAENLHTYACETSAGHERIIASDTLERQSGQYWLYNLSATARLHRQEKYNQLVLPTNLKYTNYKHKSRTQLGFLWPGVTCSDPRWSFQWDWRAEKLDLFYWRVTAGAGSPHPRASQTFQEGNGSPDQVRTKPTGPSAVGSQKTPFVWFCAGGHPGSKTHVLKKNVT